MLESLVVVPGSMDLQKDIKKSMSRNFAVVDDAGRLILPPEMAGKIGLAPGDQVYVEPGEDTLRLHRPITRPARIYVEPTTRCNMNCAMCQRHTWTDAPADMHPEIFKKILAALEECEPVPTVVFGGFGEPLMHPEIMHFIKECKKRDAPVELITNGLLLTRVYLAELKSAKIDRLWLSIDGISENGSGHQRDNEGFNRLMDNLKSMFAMGYYSGEALPRLGFVFVAEKENIAEFPEVM
jgi:MoaA/NifB/PqqE/SkfB family radical SAM enzyme